MSLIGIDIGSSSIKIGAYNDQGSPLAVVSEVVSLTHPGSGLWEVDPESVWKATKNGLRKLVAHQALKREPPRAIAISASGREAFPVDSDGNALGPCISAGDLRRSGLEEVIAREASHEWWLRACGHIPERMDPVFRYLWWKKNRPEIVGRTRYFLGWHEFLTLKMTGRAITDRSLASKWLVYELETRGWSDERLSKFDISSDILPEILPWGVIIGSLKREVCSELNLPSEIKMAVGGFDASCSALGAGVSKIGTGCLLSGTWEDLIVPVPGSSLSSFSDLADRSFSLGPHPGEAGMAIFGLSPNGTSILNWSKNLLKISLDEVDMKLDAQDMGPSPVLGIPHLSGATVPWSGGGRFRGSVMGLTLASSNIDIVKSLLESIVYDLSFTLNLLKESGVSIGTLRGAGGGIRSHWWTQLKSDLTMTPIEVTSQDEPGTLGAAMLAGLALNPSNNLEQMLSRSTTVYSRFEPDQSRRDLYKRRIQLYESAVEILRTFEWHELYA